MKYVQVADDIQTRIQRGQMQPGSRLPGERELADQYRIANGTARRVIQELRDRGIAQTVPSKGTFIVEPPASESLYAYVQVADRIAARIASGELAPGARLEGERELAEALGVAIGTVRRAVEDLRERGLVVTLPAKGTYIAERASE
jgi:DNA-binding GntR family transcriptional regulator